MSKFCRKCGVPLQENQKFCPKCGTSTIDLTENVLENHQSIQNNQPVIIPKFENVEPQKEVNADKPKRSVSTRILSILLSILFFYFSLSAVIVGVTRMYLNEDNIQDVLSDIELDEINIGYGDDDYISIENYILDNIDDSYINKYNLTKDTIKSILNDRDIDRQVKSYVKNYVDNLTQGENSKKLTEDDIIEILQDNAYTIYRITDYELTDKDYQDIREELESGDISFLVPSNLEDELDINLGVMRMLLSIITLIALIVISVLILILILKVNDWRFTYLFKYSGVTLIILGVLLVLISLAGLIFTLIADIYLINVLIRPLLISILIIGGIALVVGIALFALYRLIFKRQRA